ncbi:MAG TPA: hypothetical protein VGT41_01485 [Candidatus Babeliales bacterium]|nr:hypothetical protein [Candidatus Babeliales bacterium]
MQNRFKKIAILLPLLCILPCTAQQKKGSYKIESRLFTTPQDIPSYKILTEKLIELRKNSMSKPEEILKSGHLSTFQAYTTAVIILENIILAAEYNNEIKITIESKSK